MTQLNLFYPPEINVDGMVDGPFEYIGTAWYRRDDGFYMCLARAGEMLAKVEVKIRRSPIA